jgi:hypothetical protein
VDIRNYFQFSAHQKPAQCTSLFTQTLVSHAVTGVTESWSLTAVSLSQPLLQQRNHNVTRHRDADTPRKQAFTHTEALLQQLQYVQPLHCARTYDQPLGLGHGSQQEICKHKSTTQYTTMSLTGHQDISLGNTTTSRFTAYIS